MRVQKHCLKNGGGKRVEKNTKKYKTDLSSICFCHVLGVSRRGEFENPILKHWHLKQFAFHLLSSVHGYSTARIVFVRFFGQCPARQKTKPVRFYWLLAIVRLLAIVHGGLLAPCSSPGPVMAGKETSDGARKPASRLSSLSLCHFATAHSLSPRHGALTNSGLDRQHTRCQCTYLCGATRNPKHKHGKTR
jgi:hypothetical protein